MFSGQAGILAMNLKKWYTEFDLQKAKEYEKVSENEKKDDKIMNYGNIKEYDIANGEGARIFDVFVYEDFWNWLWSRI